jgi:trimethylamine--corrinoid protein Co-methyltransferase
MDDHATCWILGGGQQRSSTMSRRRRTRDRLRSERSDGIKRLPWRNLRNPLPPIEILSADQVETIHRASLKVLAEIGMKVLGREARDVYRQAGADVDEGEETVRFDPTLVEELVAKAPPEFTVEARDPARSITLGTDNINFTSVGGPSFCADLDKGRRAGTYREMCDFVSVVQMLDIVHGGGASPFEPLDLPAPSRHLDKIYAGFTLTNKAFACSLLGGARARDGLMMRAIAQGLDLEDMRGRPMIYGNVNTNSPRQLDASMADGLMTLARYGQPVVITPFTLCGAMAPATVAGALVQQNAEALAVIALAQAVNPSTPVVYGGFTSNVDMKTGAPAFGTPEYTQACQAAGQMARRYRLPYRSSNTTASNAVDAQAAYESEMSIWGAVMGHANLIFHGAGWLEGGLVASFEKLIIDAEMLQMMACYLEPLRVDEDTLALDAIAEVQAGGHYFGATHTLARYETAFYEPLVSDWRNFETWEEAGALTATQRANQIWKELLKIYEKPPMDPAVDEALQAYVAKRKEEIERDPESMA